jgi:hypothetical protein
MTLEQARTIADAVLMEGYVLYPYRASSVKNRYRFTFGALAPRTWSEPGGCEPWWMEAQCLLRPATQSKLSGVLRFLHARRRTIEAARPEGVFERVERLDVDGQPYLSWDEGDVREVPLQLDLSTLPAEQYLPFKVDGASSVEELRDEDNVLQGRAIRESHAVSGLIELAAVHVQSERPLLKLRVRVANTTAGFFPGTPRDAILPGALLAAHLILSIENGELLSTIDPPEWASAAARECRCTRVYPALVGSPEVGDVMLASPIILYDYPRIAPESHGDFYDASEIDELLTLRTATLTPDEQRLVRATDPRAAALLDRVTALPASARDQLHGTLRNINANAEMIPLPTGSPQLAPGARVRLRPSSRRTDAQDLLHVGRVAIVEEVRHDVDGRDYVGVTLEDDPAADLHRWKRRFLQYTTDEVELLTP